MDREQIIELMQKKLRETDGMYEVGSSTGKSADYVNGREDVLQELLVEVMGASSGV